MGTTLDPTADSLDLLNRSFLLNFPKDAARKIETMAADEVAPILQDLPAFVLLPVWERLAPGVSDRLLLALDHAKATDLIVALDAGHSAAILGRLNSAEQEQFLADMEPSIAQELRGLLEYPSGSAGRIMDTRFVAIHSGALVTDALAQLKHQKIEALRSVLLIDDAMHLVGEVEMQRLALAEGDEPLLTLAKPAPPWATALDRREEVIDLMQRLKVDAVPVVDGNERLVGIVHENRIIDVLNETVSTDLQTMVGVSKDERALSSAWFAVKKRQPWLQVNLITAFMAAAVVGMFEGTIAKYTALAILLPIAAGQSGNTGAQALAVTMRGLTLREITVRHWLRVTLKELQAAFLNGIAIAVTCGTCVYLWSRSEGLALIIALAMISSMTIAAVAGALVPIVLKRLGQDPALSSSIILTTVTDIAGFISFLGIATSLSGLLES